jgi:hypothetical protein
MDIEWMMLNFTLPKEPSRVRVSVWRKLKKCGSLNIGHSMWLLPASEDHLGIITEIANEITQNNGTAYIMKVEFISRLSSEEIIEMFNKVRDEEYQEFLDKCADFFREIEKETTKENFSYIELEENEDEYNKLEEWLKKIAQRDFFTAPLKSQAEQKLYECQELLKEFSSKVYKLNED